MVLRATRVGVGLNATATAWLIRRFLDPLGAVGFDAPGARYPDVDGGASRGSFERLVVERLSADPALVRLAAIVRDAEGRRRWKTPLVRLAALAYEAPSPSTVAPEAPGLWAISQGFGDAGRDDFDVVTRASFLYDSLYAHLRRGGGA